jgi:hypothetical protein
MDWFTAMLKSLYDIRTANQYLDQFDKRFATIPSFTGIKKFPKGIGEHKYTTGSEWADIFKVHMQISINTSVQLDYPTLTQV